MSQICVHLLFMAPSFQFALSSFFDSPHITQCSLSCSTLLYFILPVSSYSLHPIASPHHTMDCAQGRSVVIPAAQKKQDQRHHFVHLVGLANREVLVVAHDPHFAHRLWPIGCASLVQTERSQSANQIFKMLAPTQVWQQIFFCKYTSNNP